MCVPKLATKTVSPKFSAVPFEVLLTALIVTPYSQCVPGPGQQPGHLPLSPGDLLGQAGPALVRQQAGGSAVIVIMCGAGA